MVKDKEGLKEKVNKDAGNETHGREAKKRRKDIVPLATSPKLPKIDSYKAYKDNEDIEVAKRSSEKNYNEFHTFCDAIKSNIGSILELKTKGSSNTKEIDELRISTSLKFIQLRKLNRYDKLKLNQSRANTAAAKLKVDGLHLQLQNLLYEVLHLQKEVNKCLQFKSQDEDIDLIPLDEFYRDAPEDISRPSVTKTDLHQQKIARLDWELVQRKQLGQQCHESESLKDVVAKAIKKKEEYFENLGPSLDKILKATEPLQEYLDMPLNRIKDQNNLASVLPQPLFILYVQSQGYKEACDKLLNIQIKGSLEDVKNMNPAHFKPVVNDSDSEVEVELQDTEGQEEGKHKKRHKHKSKAERLEEVKQRTFRVHPCSVELEVKASGDDRFNSKSIVLEFFYIPYLRIVTVKCHCVTSHMVTNPLLNPDSILCNLFGEDSGTHSPNIANNYQLRRLGLDSFDQYVGSTGHAYMWAQRLAGLQFPDRDVNSDNLDHKKLDMDELDVTFPEVNPDHQVSSGYMEKVIVAIRERYQSRMALQKQLFSLEKLHVIVSPSMVDQFPAKVVSRLASWRSVTWEDYRRAQSTQWIVDSDLVNSSFYFYRTVVTRDKGSGEHLKNSTAENKAQLIVLIAINPSYPKCAPIFTLSLHWKGERTAQNWDALRELESEVNVYYNELCKPDHQLLCHQLQRLLMCTDILLETECLEESPAEYPKSDKIYFRHGRSRHHSKPYKYISKLGIFTQR